MQTEHLEARASASLSSYPRVGIVVPKHRQKIVDRNRVKRRLREIVRTRLLGDLHSVDLLIRAKPQAYQSSFGQLSNDVTAIGQWVSQLTR
jgi:ribonuclease P protein component